MPQRSKKVSAIEEDADLRSALAAILKGTPGYACAGIYGPEKAVLNWTLGIALAGLAVRQGGQGITRVPPSGRGSNGIVPLLTADLLHGTAWYVATTIAVSCDR